MKTVNVVNFAGIGFGVFWYAWGKFGFGWGLLYGLFWTEWLGYNLAEWVLK